MDYNWLDLVIKKNFKLLIEELEIKRKENWHLLKQNYNNNKVLNS